ncbi:MAG: hypothetical protein WA790_20440 [Sulfitobacter sp.]
MFPKSRVGPKRDQTGARHLAAACDLFCVTQQSTTQCGVFRNDRVPPLVRAQKE